MVGDAMTTDATEWVRDKRVLHHFFDDAKGRPAGGTSHGPGLELVWQNGPEQTTGHRGCQVEDLIDAAVARLEYYQRGDFKCIENARALDALHEALLSLEARTRNRIDRGVEGQYEQ